MRRGSTTVACSLDIKLPDKFNASYFGALNDRWDLMADVQWTGWSSIPVFKVDAHQR